PSKPHNPVKNSLPSDKFKVGTYANVVKDIHATPRHVTHSLNNPAVVLDDSCFVERDLSRHVMGKVKELSYIQNLSSILAKEGFLEVKLSYLGGMWVLLEFDTAAIKDKVLCHTGVNSWFSVLQAATNDFISEERVVWVDIEGIPMHVWSRDTFLKIGKKWGEAMDIEESFDSSFARKRLDPQLSDEEVAGDSDDEGVSDTVFGDYHSPVNNMHNDSTRVANQHSEDPFGIYNLLNRPLNENKADAEPSLTHPPGFTPEVSIQKKNQDSIPQKENVTIPVASSECFPKVHS
nr:RNA-directed DNA polymerase, eukaryota [Tanacetum cinerariifolium]